MERLLKVGVRCESAKGLELREIKAWSKTETYLPDWNLQGS